MWLYTPEQSCPCVSAKPGSNLASSLRVWTSDPPVTWNGKPMRRRTLPALWKREPCLRLLSGLMCEQSVMQDSAISWKASTWTSSPEATPVSRSAQPDRSVAQTILATYGQPLLKQLAYIGRRSAFSKTLPPISSVDMPKLEPGSKAWITELRKDYLQRVNWVQDIVVNGSLSLQWPTPNAGDAQAGQSDLAHRRQISLPRTVGRYYGKTRQWPSPAARDYRSPNSKRHIAMAAGNKHLDQLPNYVCHCFHSDLPNSKLGSNSPKSDLISPLRLNPEFVGWLMGFPYAWGNLGVTDSGFMVTQLSRWSQRMRGFFCGLIYCLDPHK
jgi:hypothetical protein